MAIEVPQNEEISGGGKNEGRKGVGSAIRRRGASRGAYRFKKWQQRGIVKRDVDRYIIREGKVLPDENDDAAASVRGSTRENARLGVGAIRKQSRESRNTERGR